MHYTRVVCSKQFKTIIFNSRRVISRGFVQSCRPCRRLSVPLPTAIVKGGPFNPGGHSLALVLVSSKMSTTTDLVVQHDPDKNKFFIMLGKEEAKLEYVRNGDVLNMWHTEVPPALQGKGIAKVLAQEAFNYAVKNELKMLLTCTYLQKFYKENPMEEYKRLVV